MLLERDREVELLAGLLAGVGSSGGKVVLVRGEAGVGKTSLVREFVERHSDEAHVLWGFCDDLMTPQPLGPFHDMARAEPGIHDALTDGDRPALFEALLDLLSRSLRPTVLVIEDTQWAGEATLDALSYLGRRINTTNGLLLLTYRDEAVDHDHPLRGVIGAIAPADITRIRLDCLSADAVTVMLEGTAHDLATVMDLTDGNALFVAELASAPATDQIPVSIRDTVLAKAAKLSPQAHDVLKALSVIPQPIPLPEAEQLTSGATDGLVECEHHGLVEVGDNLVGFRHELIRRAVEESLTGGEREAANRVALEMLSAQIDPTRLVHLARAAGDIDRLIELAPQAAAAAAAVGSHREAAAHYRTLEPHLDRLEPDIKGPILDSWATEERLIGNYDEMARIANLAVLHYRERGDSRLLSAALANAAYACEWRHQRAEAERLAGEAIEVLGPDAEGSDLVPAYEVSSYLAMMGHDAIGTLRWADRALDAAGPDADETLIIHCLDYRGVAENVIHYPDGNASLGEAADRAAKAGNWFEFSRALDNQAEAALVVRDLRTAADSIERSIAAVAGGALPGREGYTKATHSRVLELQGAWEQAEDIARGLLDHGVFITTVALPVIGAIEARQGRQAAGTTLTHAWQLAATIDEYQRLAPAAAALAESGWITGDSDIPIPAIVETMDTGLNLEQAWEPGAIALWLWKTGELVEAPEGIAEPYRLIIDGEPLKAAEMWAEIGCPYEQAIALSHGPPDAQLQALEKLETLGATAVAAKLRQQLRDQGLKVPRGKAHSTRQHAVGLTARQAEVLALLGEGLTNPEIADRLFVSPRTVEHHVSAVLSKLDATTRQDAVSQAHQQGLLAPPT